MAGLLINLAEFFTQSRQPTADIVGDHYRNNNFLGLYFVGYWYWYWVSGITQAVRYHFRCATCGLSLLFWQCLEHWYGFQHED